jgi:hypothetical protein
LRNIGPETALWLFYAFASLLSWAIAQQRDFCRTTPTCIGDIHEWCVAP